MKIKPWTAAIALAATLVVPETTLGEMPDPPKAPWKPETRGGPHAEAIRQLDGIKSDAIKWGMEKKPRRGTVIELSEPLPKTFGDDWVQVEWFQAFVDKQGRSAVAWRAISRVLATWNIGGYAKIATIVRPVGKGPKLNEEFNTERRLYQELLLGWKTQGLIGREIEDEPQALLFRTLLMRGKARAEPQMRSREDAERIIRSVGLSVEEWRENLEEEGTERAIKTADERWSHIVTEGRKHHLGMFNDYPEPILLINGKWLITANAMRRHGSKAVEHVFLAANWTIREEMKAATAAANAKKAWITARTEGPEAAQANMEGVVALTPGWATQNAAKVEVELFYGSTNADEAWLEFERMSAKWQDTTKRITDIHKSPTRWVAKEDSVEQVHYRRAAILAGRKVVWEEAVKNYIHKQIRDRRFGKPPETTLS